MGMEGAIRECRSSSVSFSPIIPSDITFYDPRDLIGLDWETAALIPAARPSVRREIEIFPAMIFLRLVQQICAPEKNRMFVEELIVEWDWTG